MTHPPPFVAWLGRLPLLRGHPPPPPPPPLFLHPAPPAPDPQPHGRNHPLPLPRSGPPPPAAGEALARAIRDGKIGVSALFAQPLTGILDHETFARLVWPAGLFAREHGLGYQAAQLADVPGQSLTFPTLLAASGVRYLASAVNPERAAPLLSPADAVRAQLGGGEWTTYPQLYWWEGPDGGPVVPWPGRPYTPGPAVRVPL